MVRSQYLAGLDAITHSAENKLLEFIEWAGKGAERPLSYNAVEKTFFKEFLYKKALESPIDEGLEQGTNPRALERDQMIRLMSLFAEVFFVEHWDPDLGGRQIESRLLEGEKIAEGQPYIITDRHAYLETAAYFNDPSGLDHIDWTILQNRDFKRDPEDPGKFERYQAEALVHERVPLEALLGMAVHGESQQARVQDELTARGLSVKLVVRPNWYF